MQEYSITRGTVGWYASAAPIAVAISAIPIGIIGSRFSLKKTFAVGALLQAAGVFAPLCHDYSLILLIRIVYALGTAITVPVATAILAEWFTSRELPFINGLTISFVSLGNTLAFVATVPLATLLAWRAPITIYGAFAFTCAMAWIIFGRERSKGSPGLKRTGVFRSGGPELNVRQALTQRSTIILALAVMGAWCLGNAMGSWLPTYYHEVFGMSLTKSSSILQ
jgi:MFS family permease